MAALLVLNYDVTDADALAVYRAATTDILLGPGKGEVVAVTDATVDLAEGASAGTHTVVLRFDSAERAREIYDSAEYQAAIGDRFAATRPRIGMIVPADD